MSEYKSRFCPSPTGFLHLGNLRTALLNVLLALQTKGTFLLRIEDTDQERSEKKYADAVCEDLKWMNLNWQEGPEVGGEQDSYFQSERNDIYVLFYEKFGSASAYGSNYKTMILNGDIKIKGWWKRPNEG